jgi:predicted metal-dependent hydrolase
MADSAMQERVWGNGRTQDSPGAVAYVRHPRARRYVVRVLRNGVVRVTIPRRGSRMEAEDVVRRHAGWIVRQRARVAAIPQPAAWPPETRALRREAEQVLAARTRELAAQHRLAPSRITVRRQRSRWGSCSRRGTISLNWRLLHAPDFARDYVILHELMHLRELNHSPRFWALVEAACPRRREAETWLKKHATLLPDTYPDQS